MTAYNDFVKQYATDNNLTYRQAQQEIKQNDDYNIAKSISKKISQPDYEKEEIELMNKSKIKKQQCEANNMDYNPFTNRCRKKCKDGYERDKYFDCKKIPKPKKPNQLPVEEFNLNVLKFVNNLEENGQKYVVSGIHYSSINILENILYEYLIEKYNTNCFLYGYTKDYEWKPLFINIYKYGLLGNANYLSKYQKYVYKMIKLIMNCIQKIQNTEQEVLIIPITLWYSSKMDGGVFSSHANMLIYRKSLNIIEHYEPHGKKMGYKTDINLAIKNIMKIIINKMNTINKQNNYKYYKGKIKYIPPNDTCIYSEGLQAIEGQLFLSENINKKEGRGFCMIWTIFFAEMTLANPTLSSKEILDNVIELIDSPSSNTMAQNAKNVIRGYLEYVYNSINPIVEKIIGEDMTQVDETTISEKITNTISSGIFEKLYKNYMSQKFEKYNKVNMKQYFEEPEDDDVFTELTPQNVIPNYSVGMFQFN
jgi:hypothetical protein